MYSHIFKILIFSLRVQVSITIKNMQHREVRAFDFIAVHKRVFEIFHLTWWEKFTRNIKFEISIKNILKFWLENQN